MSYNIGLMGLAVMGQNLVLNMVDHGFKVAVFNRTTSKVDEFIQQNRPQYSEEQLVGTHSLKELVSTLERPRKVMLMIQSKDAVPAPEIALYPNVAAIDAVIEELLTLLEPGDVIIDGGNTHFRDTERRTKFVENKGLLYIGTGVSGGEEGARKGPSMMPGGTEKAWELVKPIFQAISAKVGANKDIPCCEWVGVRGAGHYVKMVHNGIEYGDMQLIGEAYWMLKNALGFTNEQLHETFAEWNKGELDSYLIDITKDIFTVTVNESQNINERDCVSPANSAKPTYLVDLILDTAGAKGTGKWMSQLALDVGAPSSLVTEAVYARCISAMKEARVNASKILKGAENLKRAEETLKRAGDCVPDSAGFVEQVRQALYASKICSYAQGYVQLQAAAKEYGWDLKFGEIAMLWRGGCIIRAVFLERIKEAFDKNPNLENLLLDPYFQKIVEGAQTAWRNVVKTAIDFGIPVPAFSTALSYYDSYRSANLPANLLQAQRDYFGAHTYHRLDKPGEGPFHTDWINEKK